MTDKQDEQYSREGLKLAELVAYQKNAVVSKTLINKGAGTVTLFAFDAGEGLSEHTAPFDAMVCVMDGAADIFISGKKHALGAGEMIIMPAGKPHALKANGPFKMMLIMIKGGQS